MFRLKDIMQDKGISNVELAKRMGMTPVSISYMVTGKTEPNVTKLHELAKALEVEPWELFSSRDDIMGNEASLTASPTVTCPKCGARLKVVEDGAEE